MSSSSAADSSLTRYRPVILTLAGVSAAYAIYLIRKNYLAANERHPPRTSSLHRQGAVRHHQHSRPRRRAPSAPEARVRVENAIEGLQARESEGRQYEVVEMPGWVPTRPVQFDLLPSRLPTVQELEERYGASAEEARDIRVRAEELFVRSFLRDAFAERTISQLEEQYLRIALLQRGISYDATSAGISHFNDEQRPVSRAGPSRDGVAEQNPSTASSRESQEWFSADQLLAVADAETIADDISDDDWRGEINEDSAETGQAQGLQNLVYQIAKDQANREGYIHRGVSCNSCGTLPIRGIRYRCANCNDYDLCEECEAMQVHNKTHLFFKVRIPAPFLGNSRPALPVWYPGKPYSMPREVPRKLGARLREENDLEMHDLDALWDQFKCLAATEWADDPNHIGMAIDRKTFDKCFLPATSVRPPPPNLLYDRMFGFYDSNGDGLIGFEEFISGVASLSNTARDEKLKRIFMGYDLDSDGLVNRKDFLRIFRAWFIVQKELTKDAIAGLEDEFTDGAVRDVVMGSQPISAAFPGPIPQEQSTGRGGIGKSLNEDGDLVIIDGQGPLRNDIEPEGNRHETIADAAVPNLARDQMETRLANTRAGALRRVRLSADPNNDFESQLTGWDPEEDGISSVDVIQALGKDVPLEEIMDPVDRARVIIAREARLKEELAEYVAQKRRTAMYDRWNRRDFYTDQEEGSSAPPGYQEDDSSGEEDAEKLDDDSQSVSDSRLPSPRSRSSSKVRFEDDVTDTEYETRSNTSSRSIPVGERWGGYELAEMEKDVGKDLLYLSVQQGFNDLLDDLFKGKEDLALEARKTREERKAWEKEILAYEARRGIISSPQVKDPLDLNPTERPLNDLLVETGYSVQTPSEPRVGSITFDASGLHVSQELPEQAATSPQTGSLTDSRVIPNDGSVDIPHPSTSPALRALGDPTEGIDDTAMSSRRERGSITTSRSSPLQQVESASSTPADSQSPEPDPTLPQFRPDTPTVAQIDETDTAAPLKRRSASFKQDNPAARAQLESLPPLQPYPDDKQLAVWAKHRAYEIELKARDNKEGTLNYDEFLRKMVGESGVSPFGPQSQPGGGRNTNNGKGLESLIGTGELSRLGFLGSWIEMASF